jgi:hypothetical protein
VTLFGFEIRVSRRKRRTPRTLYGAQLIRLKQQLANAHEDVRRLTHMLDHPDEPMP